MKKIRIIFVLFLLIGVCTMSCCQSVSFQKDNNYRTYYEIFPGSFYDSNQDGIGDLNGINEKLYYLNDGNVKTSNDLGITGIYLMPIMQSPSYHKYDVVDYQLIDSDYGTIDDYKRLVKECHKRDIKIILDLPVNHTSSEHTWFLQAATALRNEDTQNPYIDYYHFKKGKEKVAGYWQLAGTDWYYEGQFGSHMPDLNLDSSKVQEEVKSIIRFWMDLGTDGFRLDAVKEYYTGSHVKSREALDWITEYTTSIDPNAYVVAEVWDTFGTIAFYYESKVSSVFNYAFGDSSGMFAVTANNAGNHQAGFKLAQNMALIQETFHKRNEHAIEAYFLSNHDNNRSCAYVGYDPDKIKLMAGMELMMNGCTFLYYGEEIGMCGNGKDENKRGPMLWSKEDITGTCKGPQQMEPQEEQFLPVADQQKDPASIWSYYRDGIRLRNEIEELTRGTITVITGLDPDLAVVTKTYKDSKIYLILNISPQEKILNVKELSQHSIQIIGQLNVSEKKTVRNQDELILPPYGILILR